MVRYSLVIVTTLAHLVSGLLWWFGLKHYVRSQDRLKEWTSGHAG